MTQTPSDKHSTAGGDDGATPLAKSLFGWTDKPWTANLFLFGVGLIAIGVLAGDFFIHKHAYKSLQFSATHMFYGLYGFAAFSFVVLCGWPLGRILRRRVDYYDDEPAPAADDGGEGR